MKVLLHGLPPGVTSQGQLSKRQSFPTGWDLTQGYPSLFHSGSWRIPNAKTTENSDAERMTKSASRVKCPCRWETTPSSIVDASRSRNSNMLTDFPSCEQDFTITFTVAQIVMRCTCFASQRNGPAQRVAGGSSDKPVLFTTTGVWYVL